MEVSEMRAAVEAAWERTEFEVDDIYGTRLEIDNGLFPDVVSSKYTFRDDSEAMVIEAASISHATRDSQEAKLVQRR